MQQTTAFALCLAAILASVAVGGQELATSLDRLATVLPAVAGEAKMWTVITCASFAGTIATLLVAFAVEVEARQRHEDALLDAYARQRHLEYLRREGLLAEEGVPEEVE